jgi:hypothetical protein
MRTPSASTIIFAVGGLVLGMYLTGCSSQTQSTQGSLVDITVKKIALMPFQVGPMESPDAPITKPVSQRSAEDAMIESQDLPDGTNLVMNRLVNAALKFRYAERLVPADLVEEACRTLALDQTLNTQRKRAIALGNALEANLVMVGSIWWFRERGALKHLPDTPAAVGFGLYLIDPRTGARLWRGRFEGTQEALTADLLGGVERLDMGLQWLSATELARYGVRSVLRTLPLK